MLRMNLIRALAGLILATPSLALATFEWELGGVEWSAFAIFENKTGVFTTDGPSNNEQTSTDDTKVHDAGDVWTFENSANVFVNAEFTDDTSAHLQANFIGDTEGANGDFNWYQRYSQYDYLKELYVDHRQEVVDRDVYFRLGKQQVVWGTADGIKLLDIINPTDFRHFVQDDFEDSRITTWMANIDIPVRETGSLQLIVSQSQENFVPGLVNPSDGDSGQPFILKGVDTITGQVNGFLNITPPLGSTATAFQGFAAPAPSLAAAGGAGFTVQDFVNGSTGFCPGGTPPPGFGSTCAEMLDIIAQSPGLGGNQDRTALVEPTYDSSEPTTAFEYLSEASFATFDTFSGARSVFRRDLPSSTNPNAGFRFKDNIGANINYSLNYYYSYDANPVVRLKWEDSFGNELKPFTTSSASLIPGNPEVTTVALRNSDGTTFTSAPGNRPVLVFEETLERIHNIGAAFDAAYDIGDRPFVFRGEFLYQKDVHTPVIDRSQLGIGNLTEGLRPEKADFFKYVLGVESIFLTNLTVSAQFIQFINLDYVDEDDSSVTGTDCEATVNPVNCGRYTADGATLHLSNNLAKGEEFDNFLSLFLSKPFGEAQRGRLNNLTIWEEGDGYWNRLDGEYEFTDELIGTFAWNHYFGDRDTTFGQFHNSSNINVGFKYIFE